MGLHREDVFNNLNIVHIRGAWFRSVLGTLTLSVQFCNQNLHNSAKLSGICSKDSNVRSSLLPFSMAFLKYAFTAESEYSRGFSFYENSHLCKINRYLFLPFKRNASVKKSDIYTVTIEQTRPDLNKSHPPPNRLIDFFI